MFSIFSVYVVISLHLTQPRMTLLCPFPINVVALIFNTHGLPFFEDGHGSSLNDTMFSPTHYFLYECFCSESDAIGYLLLKERLCRVFFQLKSTFF